VKAVVVGEFGGPETLRVADVADPVPGPGQVRVAVKAAGTNPVDAQTRAGGDEVGMTAPFIPGYDIAGVVERTGPGVTGLAAGDRVMAMTHFPGGAGGYAELAVVDAGQAARIGARTSFTDAAAVPLAAGTAVEVLARLALPRGGRLLVLGASGGVGLFLLQLAATAGIETIAVGRAAMHGLMRTLGAAGCIDYTTEDVTRRTLSLAGGPVDAVADLVGGGVLAETLGALRPRGQIAAIATPDLGLDPVLDFNITFHGVLITDDGERTGRLAGLLARGALRPVISHVLPLAEAAEAHRILDGKHSGGKIVLAVGG
jgi:NADPH:quinone reductase